MSENLRDDFHFYILKSFPGEKIHGSLAGDEEIREWAEKFGGVTLMVTVRYDPYRMFSPKWAETVDAAEKLISHAVNVGNVKVRKTARVNWSGASCDAITAEVPYPCDSD